MKKLLSREILARIKPELSTQPVAGARIDLDCNQLATLTVDFLLTQELLEAIAEDSQEQEK